MVTKVFTTKKEYIIPSPDGIKLTKDPDIFTLEDDPLKPRGQMSCGHAVLPASLTFYALSEVSKGKVKFTCPFVDPLNPLNKCEAEWSYPEVRKMAVLSEQEKTLIELKLCQNKLVRVPNVIECPRCKSYILKRGKKINRIRCRRCIKEGHHSDFCCQCYETWSANGDQYCGNLKCRPDCREEILIQAPPIKLRDTVIPSIRACPKCGILVEMVMFPNYCKTINCICGFKFCFICLGYCNQQSTIFPCYETGGVLRDTQKHMKIECKPKDVQDNLKELDANLIAANLQSYIANITK